MQNTITELCELLSAQEQLRQKQKKLWIAYLSERGKIATCLLRERSAVSDQVHEVMRRIAVLSLNLAYND
jgi:hypothetical protein